MDAKVLPPEMRAGESALQGADPLSQAAEPCLDKMPGGPLLRHLTDFTLKEQNSTKHMAGDGELEERRIVFPVGSCS